MLRHAGRLQRSHREINGVAGIEHVWVRDVSGVKRNGLAQAHVVARRDARERVARLDRHPAVSLTFKRIVVAPGRVHAAQWMRGNGASGDPPDDILAARIFAEYDLGIAVFDLPGFL